TVSKNTPGKPNAGKGAGPALNSRDEFVNYFRGQNDGTENGEFTHGIPQFLRRMNTEMFNQGAPLIDVLIKTRVGRDEAIEALYLATLSRRPTGDETRLLGAYVDKRDQPEQGYAGVLWILLNSGEFVLNH